MERIYSSEEYHEIEKRIPAQVKQIRIILEEKYKLFVPDHCDPFLARSLRMKDGNMEKVTTFHHATATFPTWDATLRPSQLMNFYKSGILNIMPKRDSLGRTIMICHAALWDPENMTFDQLAGCVWMLLQFLTARSHDVQRHGVVTIWDYKNYTMKHALAMNKWRLPYLSRVTQNGVSGRIKEFHAINHPRVISLIYMGSKPFLTEKLRRRSFFHDSLDSLLLHFDKDNLPISLGGTLEPQEYVDNNLLNDFFCQDNYFRDMMEDRFPSK